MHVGAEEGAAEASMVGDDVGTLEGTSLIAFIGELEGAMLSQIQQFPGQLTKPGNRQSTVIIGILEQKSTGIIPVDGFSLFRKAFTLRTNVSSPRTPNASGITP